MKAANLALAFVLELTALGAFAYWGFVTGDSTLIKLILGIGAPVIAAVVWGIFAAPKSERRLKGSAYLIFKVAFFALAILALMAAGSVTLGVVFAVVFAINTALLYAWHQDE